MGNQRLKLWVLVIIFAFTALFAAIPSAQAKAGSDDFDFTVDISQVFTIFFKDIRKAYDNLFRSFEKMFEEMLADFESSLEEALEEINGDIKNPGGKNINGDGQKPQDQNGPNNANNNNDGNDGNINQNNQQQGNKDDDFPNLEGDGKNNNGSNGNISSGQNIGSNPWDILNKRAQKPQDDKTGRNEQKPNERDTTNDNVNPPKPPQNNNNDNVVQQPQPPVPPLPPAPQPPVPQPPAPQPPVPPLPPNNNNQNVNNNNFKDPFDELIKQQNNQINGNNTDKNNTVDNRPAEAKELIKKIQEKFGITIVDGEPPKYVWTPQELKTTFDILSELPSSFVRKTVTLAKGSAEAVFPGMSNIGGFASGSSITITPLGLNCDYRRVLIHEMGHCFHFQTYELQNQFQQKFWSGRNGYSGSAGGANPPSISQYGNTNVMEDMAESIAYYVVYGKSMKQISPERYELVKTLVMENKEW